MSMKAMVVEAYGDESVFTVQNVAMPELKQGHVVVKVAASSVNTVDTMIRTMGDALPLSPATPAILGMDFAGVVTEVADDITDFNVGDEVYGCAGGLADIQGALAEYMLVDARLIALKPKNMSMKEAAAIPLVGITAYEGLMRAQVTQGQKVLVHGGAGGVGHIALQLAHYLGADVYATGSSQTQLDLIRDLGATGINYREETIESYVEKHTGGSGFDVVYDSVGGANLVNSIEAVALNGQIATTVSMVEMDLTAAHFKGVSLHVVFMLIPMLHNVKRDTHGEILSKLAQIIEDGKLKAVLDEKEFSFEQATEAHHRLQNGGILGKVVISVDA